MRVVYFTESLYPLVDGVSRTLARLFDTLERRQISFQVFSPFVPGVDVAWSSRVIPVRYVRFPLYPDYRISVPFGRRVSRLLEYGGDVDLVHLVSPTPAAYRAQRLAKQAEIPFVASFHTHFVSYFRHYGVSRLESVGWNWLRRFYRDCARVYAPTPIIARELEDQGIERVELWSRGIDTRSFSPDHRSVALRDMIGADENTPVLLLVSRLVKEKDLSDLVAVDRILRGRGVRFRFALVGDGPMRGDLERALPESIFAGHQSGEALANWYASADTFVFPSTTETLGNVVLEALASGLPVVVVDRGGPQDLVTHGSNGFVARSHDPESIASHLGRLLEDSALRAEMAGKARQSALSRDWETINDELVSSYERVIAEHARTRTVRPTPP